MSDVCIPLTGLKNDQSADVVVTVGGNKIQYSFRIESFPWETQLPIGKRIFLLKGMIENYDKEWELVQIYNPGENSGSIRVLFRKRH